MSGWGERDVEREAGSLGFERERDGRGRAILGMERERRQGGRGLGMGGEV